MRITLFLLNVLSLMGLVFMIYVLFFSHCYYALQGGPTGGGFLCTVAGFIYLIGLPKSGILWFILACISIWNIISVYKFLQKK